MKGRSSCKAARTNAKRHNLRNILPTIEIILFYQTLHVAHNAALSGEQRLPPYLSHCDINT
ncbi:hypothetical protein F9277_05680 [Vibrio harveyi]|nr:hypothetical protein F9277_05680 [Vibrio harveyi]